MISRLFGPKRLDCHEAAARLHEMLDGELTPKVERAVRAHLATCAPCMSLYEFERAFNRFVQKRARAFGPSDDLRERLHQRLAEPE